MSLNQALNAKKNIKKINFKLAKSDNGMTKVPKTNFVLDIKMYQLDNTTKKMSSN
jgi:hypothetical protein